MKYVKLITYDYQIRNAVKWNLNHSNIFSHVLTQLNYESDCTDTAVY